MKKIEQLRNKLGISQNELAKRIGVTQGAISQWEQGLSKPTIDKLIKLGEIFKCSVEDLLQGADI